MTRGVVTRGMKRRELELAIQRLAHDLEITAFHLGRARGAMTAAEWAASADRDLAIHLGLEPAA